MPCCNWATQNDLLKIYHDTEWGTPCFDDQRLFEFLILEGAQAGLSWLTVLKKRAAYKKAFANFNPKKVAQFDEKKLEELMENPNLIRNRLKLKSAISNAKAFIILQKKHGSFSNYLWQFVDGKPIINQWKSDKKIPASNDLSDRLSKALKKEGFNFVGSTICYSYMQAIGMINDHLISCEQHPLF